MNLRKDLNQLTWIIVVIHNSIFDLENKRRFFINRRDGFLLIEDNYLRNTAVATINQRLTLRIRESWLQMIKQKRGLRD